MKKIRLIFRLVAVIGAELAENASVNEELRDMCQEASK